MENREINSCVMLAYALYTPIELWSVFNKEDLEGTGIELDSHVTLLYLPGININRDSLLGDIEMSLNDSDYDVNNFKMFIDSLKRGDFENVLDNFELSVFENDSDYVILKLLESSPLYEQFTLINKGLKLKYKVPTEYTYTPHITLAEVKSGKGKEYVNSETLKLVLEKSKVRKEDFIVSEGKKGEVDKKKYNITTYFAVDRYFRERDLNDTSEGE